MYPAVVPDRVAVVAFVGQQDFGAALLIFDQCVVGRCVVGFTRREDEAEREAFTVRAGMDFTREATARAAKTLATSPPLAPAA